MKRLIMALIVGTVIASSGNARGEDYTAEVREWIVEPCMHVMAALGLKDIERETLDMGVNRDHIVAMMVTSRDQVTKNMASKMKKGTTWEERSAVYPAMLRLCLSQLDGMK